MLNIKRNNYDFWKHKILNNIELWEGYFEEKKITSKSKILYTGILNKGKNIMECGWVVYPDINYLLGFLQNIFIPTALLTWFYKESNDFFIPIGDFEEILQEIKEQLSDEDLNYMRVLEMAYYNLDNLWEEDNEKVVKELENLVDVINEKYNEEPNKKIYIKVFNEPCEILEFIKVNIEFEDEEFFEEETSMSLSKLEFSIDNIISESFINKRIIDILNSNMRIMF